MGAVRLRRHPRLAAVALFAGLASGCAKRSQATAPRGPASTPRHSPAATRATGPLAGSLDPYLASFGQHFGDAYRFHGHVLVARGTQILYARGFGHADRGRRTPNGPRTSFRIGSTTKQFTAAAIMLLAQQGRLRLDDPVRAHLRGYRGPGARVTIHQLLTHTSGIPDYTQTRAMAARARPHRPAELIRLFEGRPLQFTPGSRFEYSNSNYVLLGAIIEHITRKPYGRFLHEALFGPAGLRDTTYGDAPRAPDRARGYTVDPDERIVPADDIDLSFAYAAGGVRSTARDLQRWAQILQTDRILDRGARERMTTPARGGYAYGWWVQQAHGVRILKHGGTIDGFATEYIVVPERDLVIVVWSNTGQYADTVGRAALRAALGQPVPTRTETRGIALADAETRRITGTYVGPGGDRVTVVQRTTLRIERRGQPSLRLHREAPGRYFTKRAGVRVVFDLPPRGPARTIQVRQGDRAATYDRK